MAENLTDQLEKSPEAKRLLEQERLILEVTELICAIMEENNVTRSDLAKRLHRSKGYVSQLLDGSRNMTLRTLADVLSALGRRGKLRAICPTHVCPQADMVNIRVSQESPWSCDLGSCDFPWLESAMAG